MHLLGACLGWHPLLWLTQSQSVPRDIASVRLSITTCHKTRVRPTTHTLTREILLVKKYICTLILCFFFFFSVLHKLELLLGEKPVSRCRQPGWEMQSGPAVPSALPPEGSPGPGEAPQCPHLLSAGATQRSCCTELPHLSHAEQTGQWAPSARAGMREDPLAGTRSVRSQARWWCCPSARAGGG